MKRENGDGPATVTVAILDTVRTTMTTTVTVTVIMDPVEGTTVIGRPVASLALVLVAMVPATGP